MKSKINTPPSRILFIAIIILITLFLASCGETESTMTISLSTVPYITGEPITVTVSISQGDSSTSPTGGVAIGGADLTCNATLDSDGKGICNVVFNSPGDKTIAAMYLGDQVYAGQTATRDLTVIPRPTPNG